jgi:hypothetical protein
LVGYLLFGHWPDAGEGRATAEFYITSKSDNWRIAVESAWEGHNSVSLKNLAVDLAASLRESGTRCDKSQYPQLVKR